MLNPESFAVMAKANLDVLSGIATKAFGGLEQLTALNMQFIKTHLGEAAETSLAVLSAKDPQSVLALQAGLLQPSAEKAAAYGRQVYDIVLATKVEVEKIAAEQTAAVQSSLLAAIEAATRDAPAGSVDGIALFKSAMASANNAFDGLQKASRQVNAAADANYTLMSDSMVKAAGKARRS